jgi:glycerophosphoryl diester phosphodiesterase
VHVWTVNEETDIERLVKIGVDGIFTDDPLKAKKILTRS